MKVFIVSCMLLSVALAQAVPSSQPSAFLQECFEKDSISCVQSTVLLLLLFFFSIFQSISEYSFYLPTFYGAPDYYYDLNLSRHKVK